LSRDRLENQQFHLTDVAEDFVAKIVEILPEHKNCIRFSANMGVHQRMYHKSMSTGTSVGGAGDQGIRVSHDDIVASDLYLYILFHT